MQTVFVVSLYLTEDLKDQPSLTLRVAACSSQEAAALVRADYGGFDRMDVRALRERDSFHPRILGANPEG